MDKVCEDLLTVKINPLNSTFVKIKCQRNQYDTIEQFYVT